VDKHLVLIVDDDYAITSMLRRLFSLEGFRVQTASNGDEALECARKQKPDLVLLDYNLPTRNGLEVLRDLKNLYAEIKVIITTGTDDETLEHEARRSGADFLSKPLAVHELKARAHDLVS
jgi:DNA-binding response OmpR family regulator